jgi:hypothetical protein
MIRFVGLTLVRARKPFNRQHVTLGNVDSWEMEGIDCIVKGREMGHSSRRGISLALILGLNAAWLFAVTCASLCAVGMCPFETTAATVEQCRHEQAPAPNQQCPCHEHDCHWHGHPTGVFQVPAGNQAPHDSLSLAGQVLPAASIISVASAPVAALETPSHSPPGVSTGRIICQKHSLLRI